MNKKIKFSSLLNNASNLTDIFEFYKKNFPKKKFLFSKVKQNWEGKTFQEIGINIDKIINSLIKLGIKKGDRVFLLSSNRIEWVEFDIAIMSVGGITVPAFVTNNLDDNAFIIKNSSPKIIIFENDNIFKKNQVILKNFDRKKIITIEKHKNLVNYNSILSEEKSRVKRQNVCLNDISTIIYTSGTSGKPKGVTLSHKALIHNLFASLNIIKDFEIDAEKFISFLPLSHSYERMAGLYFPLLIGAEIYFCSSLDKLMNEIKEIKPTIFSGVPRLFENIFKKIKSQINKVGFFKRIILNICFNGFEDNPPDRLRKYLSQIFIFLLLRTTVRRIIGGNIKALISGGAALSPKIGLFFNKTGLSLLQGYGQTEAAPLISCNTKKFNNPDTVGFPVKDVEIKIAVDGEILVKGSNVMTGYWKNKKLTSQTIKKGWLYTGDLGLLDRMGRLVINGRKKDLIVTSGGDNISVQKIETKLSEQIEIEQAVVFGDNKPFLIALLVVQDSTNKNMYAELVQKINTSLNSLEKIRKFLLLKEKFTYENGFLTQTHKIKREEVYMQFKEEIEKLYK